MMGKIVKTIVGLAFCLVLGISIRVQGWTALLWVPAGFAFGLYATAQIVLPIILGLPRAISLVVKRQMRPAVFGAIILTPLIWFVLILTAAFLVGWFWPAAAEHLYNNLALNLSANLGIIAIILSPLSKESRLDFNQDFDKAYGRFYTEEPQNSTDEVGWSSRNPTQQKQVEAAITVASNLYLHTIPEAEEATVPLQFSLPDSRYRYLIFCLSATITAVLAYDEEKDIQPEVLVNGCLHFATSTATDSVQEYFSGPMSSQDAVNSATAYLQEFLRLWSAWPDLEKEGRNEEVWELIGSMICTTESNEPAEQADTQRLEQLALAIDCRLPTMRRAFVELISR